MGLIKRFFANKMSMIEIVELVSMQSFSHALDRVRGLINNKIFPEAIGTDPDVLNSTAWELVLELMAFTLHLADRIAFNALDPQRRDRFVDALLESVSSNLSTSILKNASLTEMKAFEINFLNLYNDRSLFYAPLPIPADSEAPLRGTLFWEAGKECASRMFPGDSEAPLLLPLVFGYCIGAVKDLSKTFECLAK